MDFAQTRRTMVDTQLRTWDVTDQVLLDAVLDVPRELFVPTDLAALAYLDADIPIPGTTRALIQPMVIAKMIQSAAITPSDVVLDVGGATGYAAAVMARLAARVVMLESDASLSAAASERLAEVGGPIELVAGPLERGWPSAAPYDVILVEGGIEFLPDAFSTQLAEGGRLVAVVGAGRAARAVVQVKQNGALSTRVVFDAAVPMLPGFARPPVFTF